MPRETKLEIRMSTQERADFKAAADHKGVPEATYARMLMKAAIDEYKASRTQKKP